MDRVVGRIASLTRFPVKSMTGETAPALRVTARGVVGDRAYAVVDTVTGKVASAKSVKTFPDILACRARYCQDSETPHGPAPVAIELPDGTTVTSEDPRVDEVLSEFFGRAVRLAANTESQFEIDVWQPAIEGMGGEIDVTARAGSGSSHTAERLGAAHLTTTGSFVDAYPVSVLTSSTIDALRRASPGSRIDARRFRMNILIETELDGLVENAWVGATLETTGGVRLSVAMPDPRCVMTTLPVGDLPRDPGILHTLMAHNAQVVGGGPKPCAGVYATVESPGLIAVGEAVRLVSPT
jgi:uncharacterized protein YcbX